jgi:multiple sugar transport system permease protein
MAEALKLLPLLLVVVVVGVGPVLSAATNAFFHDVYGERSPAGLDNFRALLGDRGFWASLRISVAWALATSTLGVAAGYLLATVLVGKGTGSRALFAGLLVPWGVPAYIAVPVWRAFLHGEGGASLLARLTGIRVNLLTDPAAAVISTLGVSLWMAVPMTAMLVAGALARVPTSAREAARLEGASGAQVSAALLLPEARGMLLVTWVAGFVSSLREFSVVFMLTSGGPPLVSGFLGRHIIGATTTIEIFLYDLFNASDDFGLPAASSVVMTGLVALTLAVWFLARSRRRRPWAVKALAAVSSAALGGPVGFACAAGYLASIRWRVLYPVTLAAGAAWCAFSVARSGFLAGFDVSLPIAAIGFLLLRPERGRLRVPGAAAGAAWEGARWAGVAAAVVSSLLLVYLVAWLSFSLRSTSVVDALLPSPASTAPWVRVLRDEHLGRYFLNTLAVALPTALLVPLVVFPAASWVARRDRRSSRFVLIAVQVVGMSGGLHMLIPLFWIFRRIGLIGSYVPLVAIYLLHALPVSLLAASEYLRGLPPGLEDSARLEGASPLVYLARVLVPLSLPTIAASMIMGFLGAWNGFLAPLVFLTDDTRYPISLKLFSLVGNIASGTPRWNLFAAGSLLNLALVASLTALLRKPISSTALSQYEG